MTHGRADGSCLPGRVARAVLLLAALLLPAGRAAGQALPADIQVSLLSKILTFDRRLERYGPDLTLGILYQPSIPESVRLARAVSDAARRIRPDDPTSKPLRPVLTPYASDAELRAQIQQQGIEILYIAPLRAVPLRRLLEQAHEAGVLTVSADPDLIQAGVAVGLEDRGPHPGVSIGLGSARRAGSDFDSRLLRLAHVRP